jgi:AraC family transcriptional activator of tynA and feaB
MSVFRCQIQLLFKGNPARPARGPAAQTPRKSKRVLRPLLGQVSQSAELAGQVFDERMNGFRRYPPRPGQDGQAAQGNGCVPPEASSRNSAVGAGVRSRDARAWDVVVTDFHTTTTVLAQTSPPQDETELRFYAVRRGDWTLRYDPTAFSVRPGHFLMRRAGGLAGFEATPRTAGRTIGIPIAEVGGYPGDAPLEGSANTPEVRLLLAHASLLHDTIADLTVAGVSAARNALIELARGVVHQYVNDTEPLLAAALARAARELADRRLTDHELTPGLLARELHVSVRTLSRAFASTGETAAGYIRRRRLEGARRALLAGRTVSQVAAEWQFADSSHFIRAFRKRYDQTPAQYARNR